jgi:hypothetical protein
MASAETLHEQGREGVVNVKRWLEATMRFDVPYTVYDGAARVTLPLLNGNIKRYDLYAQHFNAAPRTYSGKDLYVEVKNIQAGSSARGQTADFHEFVANSYSATVADWATRKIDPAWDFMFATTHPWVVNGFLQLTTEETVAKACAEHSAVLGETPYDPALGRLIAERLWIWIIPTRQDEMSLGEQVGAFLRTIALGQAT